MELWDSPDFSAYTRKIDASEASAIAVAIDLGYDVIMDHKVGRRMGATTSVPLLGTVGVLVLERRKSMVPLVRSLLERLVSPGYFLGDEIIAAALQDSGK